VFIYVFRLGKAVKAGEKDPVAIAMTHFRAKFGRIPHSLDTGPPARFSRVPLETHTPVIETAETERIRIETARRADTGRVSAHDALSRAAAIVLADAREEELSDFPAFAVRMIHRLSMRDATHFGQLLAYREESKENSEKLDEKLKEWKRVFQDERNVADMIVALHFKLPVLFNGEHSGEPTDRDGDTHMASSTSASASAPSASASASASVSASSVSASSQGALHNHDY